MKDTRTTGSPSRPAGTRAGGPHAGGSRADDSRADSGRPPEQNAGMAIFSYLLAGMLFYGGVGYLVSRLAHLAILFPIGMIVGLALAILLIVLKYGRA